MKAKDKMTLIGIYHHLDAIHRILNDLCEDTKNTLENMQERYEENQEPLDTVKADRMSVEILHLIAGANSLKDAMTRLSKVIDQ